MNESVPVLFDKATEKFKQRPAIQYFCNEKEEWVIKNWLDLAASVGKFTNALKSLKVGTNTCIALLSNTRPEWVIADIGIMKASCIVVPIYHSSLVDQIAYILSDAEVKIIVVENELQLNKVREVQKNGVKLDHVIIFDPILGSLQHNEIYLKDVVLGQKEECITPLIDKQSIASLVYTSGTTGEPKGAMISHDNLLYAAQVVEKLGILSSDDVQLIFLPLAHIFARLLELSWIRTGHLLAFAQSVEKVVDNMADIKPTIMAGVPRIFEKVRTKVMENALQSSGLKKALVQFAFHEAERLSGDLDSEGIKTFIAKKLVFDKISASLKERFGGRLRFLISGGAPLAPEVFTFFHLSGILLCEGYGLTETTAVTCLNLPWSLRPKSVGRPLPGTEVCLSDDQEILVKGRGVFLGFFKKEEETRQVFDEEGYFHTGDIGRIDQDGFVYIVDRKRDIIVTSQGKNIAPQRVENLIKSKTASIGHVVVVGDKRPFLTALIALDSAAAKTFITLKGNDGHDGSMAELATNSLIYQEVKNAIASANASLATFEQIKRFHIVDREFEIGKELTPTLKVKRKYCIGEFKKEIKTLYA